jgi:hypothetical protein
MAKFIINQLFKTRPWKCHPKTGTRQLQCKGRVNPSTSRLLRPRNDVTNDETILLQNFGDSGFSSVFKIGWGF